MSDFVMVRFDIEDDERLATIYPDDGTLGLWLRLLLLAEHAWPKPAYLPRRTNGQRLRTLVEAGCIVMIDRDRFRFHGLDAEHQRRIDRSRAAANARWSGDASSILVASGEHPSSNAQMIPATRASAPPPPSLSLSPERGVQGGDDAVEAYFMATMRAPNPRALSWLNELASEHGEQRLCAALRETPADPLKSYLSRVQVALTTITVKPSEIPPRTEEEFIAREAERRQADILKAATP